MIKELTQAIILLYDNYFFSLKKFLSVFMND